jgi:hypothetical protein
MSDLVYYNGAELRSVIQEKAQRGEGFKLFSGNKELLCSIGDSPRNVNWSLQSASTVRDAGERLNLIQLSTEFYPSSSDEAVAGIKYDNQTDDGWSDWFRRITAEANLLPDTNILLKRTLSSVILPAFTLRRRRLSLPFRIVIPRFAILELENLANTGTENTGATVDKGECFMAFNEVRTLRAIGASLTDNLSADLLGLFHSASGKKLTDVLIRDETRRFAEARQMTSNAQRSIFITRDMVSALAANCEGLTAIYIAPKFPEKCSIENIELPKLADLIVELATICEKVELKWDDGEALQVEGKWRGKNWYDYHKRRVRLLQSTLKCH